MHRQELNFLGQLVVLVFIAGGYAVLSLSSPLPIETKARPSIEVSEEDINLGPDKAKKDERLPASVASINAATTITASKSVVSSVNWNCQNKGGETIETESLQLRLKGFCKEVASLNIINASNGYTASVFTNENSEYSTDFIQLSIGENILKIQSTNEKGEIVEKQIKVVLKDQSDS
jgi:hypothetical protein